MFTADNYSLSYRVYLLGVTQKRKLLRVKVGPNITFSEKTEARHGSGTFRCQVNANNSKYDLLYMQFLLFFDDEVLQGGRELPSKKTEVLVVNFEKNVWEALRFFIGVAWDLL